MGILTGMPILKQAKKKMRHDTIRREQNELKLQQLKKAVQTTRKKPTAANLVKAFSVIDKTAKPGLLHQNRASRLKSRLAKLLRK